MLSHFSENFKHRSIPFHACSICFILSHKGKAENFGKAVAHQNYISVNLTFSQFCNDDDKDYFTFKKRKKYVLWWTKVLNKIVTFQTWQTSKLQNYIFVLQSLNKEGDVLVLAKINPNIIFACPLALKAREEFSVMQQTYKTCWKFEKFITMAWYNPPFWS